jgi:hypothetical protein
MLYKVVNCKNTRRVLAKNQHHYYEVLQITIDLNHQKPYRGNLI